MANHTDPHAFKACYAQYAQADADRNVLVSQLLESYEILHLENLQLHQQLENEKETRSMWQAHARNYKKEAAQTRLATESHPFVVMIIDGDGAKFRDEFFRNGDLGGGHAAQELKIQIRAHLRQRHPDTNVDNWNIIVYFYANMDGLAKALASRRILSTIPELQRFASGFGRTNSLFSFVDVGYGKDKADHKCREMLKLMLHVPSCRHVYFGPCRDNGYLTLLDEYRHDEYIQDKLSLFTAEPAEPGFLQLGFNIINFPTVFRSEPLNNTFTSFHTTNFEFGPQVLSPVRGLSQMSLSLDDSSDMTPPSSVGPTAASPASSVSVGNSNSNNNSTSSAAPPAPSWATISKLSYGPVIDLYTKKAPAAKPRCILVNTSNQRVDERLPPNDNAALRSIDNRAQVQGRNFCNFYHLIGACDKGEHCEYQHDVKPPLTPAERTALRHKARQIKCVDGRWCQNLSCISGHHCKNIYSGQACTWGSRCFFANTHDADVVRTALSLLSKIWTFGVLTSCQSRRPP